MTLSKPCILVVDADREVVRLIRSDLERGGCEVLATFDSGSALQIARRCRPALVVLDLMLPGQDVWQLARKFRADADLSDVPIILLTPRVKDADRRLGLELEADDYISKPFSPREVGARVRALLRRQPGSARNRGPILRCGGLMLNRRCHELTLDGQRVALTVSEFAILRALMENPGYAFSRAELIQQSLGYDYDGMERTLDSHIKNLRRKIEDNPRRPAYIRTIYGVGYHLVNPDA